MKPITIKFLIKKPKQGEPIGHIEDKRLKGYKVRSTSQLDIITQLERLYETKTNTRLSNHEPLQRIQSKVDGIVRYQRKYV